jgi:hypothetical protein
MTGITRDFTSTELRSYRFSLGTIIASALSGFIAGVAVASIIWFAVFYFMNTIAK